MYGTDILLKEHDNILIFIDIARKKCCDILEGGNVSTEFFTEAIDFGRNYADKHHHGKEEQILFSVMLENLNAEKLVRNGMLVEHDLGRFHLTELEKALEMYSQNPSTENKLDIIAAVTAYCGLLKRHIDKENLVAYPFAQRELSARILEDIDNRTAEFERNADIKKYLDWLENNK